MKKCSQSHHHALAELNITPLLDLAFVMLVIFIITTTPMVNDDPVELPKAENREKDPPTKVQFITIGEDGSIRWNAKAVTLDALRAVVLNKRQEDSDISIEICGAARAKYRNIVAVMDVLQQCAVLKINLATEAKSDGATK